MDTLAPPAEGVKKPRLQAIDGSGHPLIQPVPSAAAPARPAGESLDALGGDADEAGRGLDPVTHAGPGEEAAAAGAGADRTHHQPAVTASGDESTHRAAGARVGEIAPHAVSSQSNVISVGVLVTIVPVPDREAVAPQRKSIHSSWSKKMAKCPYWLPPASVY